MAKGFSNILDYQEPLSYKLVDAIRETFKDVSFVSEIQYQWGNGESACHCFHIGYIDGKGRDMEKEDIIDEKISKLEDLFSDVYFECYSLPISLLERDELIIKYNR